jgi:hypothetical protein
LSWQMSVALPMVSNPISMARQSLWPAVQAFVTNCPGLPG